MRIKSTFVIFSYLLFACTLWAHAQTLKGTRPNIILVLTDDQGMGDLACLGNPLINTPHLDRFYEMSTRFTDFHVSPTCAPTRSALLSGRHPFKNGVTHTIHEREIMALSTTTFPELLQRAGYETGIFGKWHLGDEDAYQPNRRGFSEMFIHGAGGIAQSPMGSRGDFPPNYENRYFDNAILHNDTIVQTKGFCTDVFFQAALGWIKEQHDAKQPYFAYISTNAPHGPFIAPEEYEQRWLKQGWDKVTAGRYGMIENIDDNFGLMMQKLKEWNALDNTLVIFMTDNGQAVQGGRGEKNGRRVDLYTANFKTGKGTVYEGGTHVPAFWYWKGVLGEGVDIPALTAHIDLYRTFCDLAGVEIPNDIQEIEGRTLLPLLENPKGDWADRELFFHRGRWPKGTDPNEFKYKNAAVRTTQWRMVIPGESDKRYELYDISVDPYEKKDVAHKHPGVVERLLTVYDQWWKETVPYMVHEDKIYTAELDPREIQYRKQLKERGIPDWEPPEL